MRNNSFIGIPLFLITSLRHFIEHLVGMTGEKAVEGRRLRRERERGEGAAIPPPFAVLTVGVGSVGFSVGFSIGWERAIAGEVGVQMGRRLGRYGCRLRWQVKEESEEIGHVEGDGCERPKAREKGRSASMAFSMDAIDRGRFCLREREKGKDSERARVWTSGNQISYSRLCFDEKLYTWFFQ